MNITVICHYFVPEIGAPSARIYEMAKRWVKEGHKVQVVTCFPNHPTGVIPENYRGMKYLKEEIDGITVHRNYVYATPNKGFIKKTLGHISFMVSSVILSTNKIGSTDVVITSSPTFFSIFSGYYFSKRKRVPFILEIRDLWPAAIVELGVLKNRFIINLLERIELFFYTKSSKLVMVTDSFKMNLISRGIDGDKIEVITNGFDQERFYPREKDEELLEKYELKDKFVVQYVGAHGISQALDKIFEVVEFLKNENDIIFMFVGEGAEKEKLKNIARDRQLYNVIFVNEQPKENIPRYYSLADVCLIPLKNIELFKTFIPSKMFEIMACSKPIIASLEGESAEILEKSKASVITPPEDVKAIMSAILTLKADTELRASMGKSGVEFVKQHYSRDMLSSRYLSLISDAVGE